MRYCLTGMPLCFNVAPMEPEKLTQILYDHFGSDAKVAALVGVHQTTINRIRQGWNAPNWVTYKALVKLVEELEEQKAV